MGDVAVFDIREKIESKLKKEFNYKTIDCCLTCKHSAFDYSGGGTCFILTDKLKELLKNSEEFKALLIKKQLNMYSELFIVSFTVFESDKCDLWESE